MRNCLTDVVVVIGALLFMLPSVKAQNESPTNDTWNYDLNGTDW